MGVARLGRILVEIVKLGVGRVDELVVAVDDHAQRCPVHVEPRQVRLRIGDWRRRLATALYQRQQAARVRRLQGRGARQLEEGGRQVDRANRLLDHARGKPSRPPQDQGDADRGLVQEHRVRLLAVVSQALAMVRGHGDQGAVANAQLLELVQDEGDHRIVEGDLAVVRPGREGIAKRGRGPIGLMRIVQVQPDEERRGLRRGYSSQWERGSAVLSPRRSASRARTWVALPPSVVVGLEAPGQAVAAVEDEGAHEGGRPVALLSEDRGQGRETVREVEVAVVPDAVLEGVEAREDRGVGREA